MGIELDNGGAPDLSLPMAGATALLARHASRIAALPPDARLTRPQLLIPDLLLHEEGRLAVYYAPFDYVSPRARIILVGITPGFRQMEIALRAARDALVAGEDDLAALCARVKYLASFAGPIRHFLLAMLDGIGIPAALGIPASAALYAERRELLQTSAVVRHPTFVHGRDWTGHAPAIRRSPLLRRYLWETFLPEVRSLPDALVITLGTCASDGVAELVAAGALDPARCLIGLPHPSGANGHRHARYARVREELAGQVAAWFGR